jgi:hypothetical protein
LGTRLGGRVGGRVNLYPLQSAGVR